MNRHVGKGMVCRIGIFAVNEGRHWRKENGKLRARLVANAGSLQQAKVISGS